VRSARGRRRGERREKKQDERLAESSRSLSWKVLAASGRSQGFAVSAVAIAIAIIVIFVVVVVDTVAAN
jgi:hypothetical protein